MIHACIHTQTYDGKVDVYSYAVVLWYMIHGDVPLSNMHNRDFFLAGTNSGNPAIWFNLLPAYAISLIFENVFSRQS